MSESSDSGDLGGFQLQRHEQGAERHLAGGQAEIGARGREVCLGAVWVHAAPTFR